MATIQESAVDDILTMGVEQSSLDVKIGEDAACATFSIGNEGHTLGNALRSVIARHKDVSFCGYSVPHPSEKFMNVRVQTYELEEDAPVDGSKKENSQNGAHHEEFSPAVGVFRESLENLRDMAQHVLQTFDKASLPSAVAASSAATTKAQKKKRRR